MQPLMVRPEITETASTEAELLIPEDEWAEPDLYLNDYDDRLRLTLAGAIQYSGLGSISGLVLGFRIIQHVVDLTAGKKIPVQRGGISINSALRGRGTQDAFEFTCRAISGQRYCCDTTLHHPLAQSGQRGDYLFTVRINDQTLVLTPVDGFPPNSFLVADRESRGSKAATLQWRHEKIKFANTLLRLKPEQCLRVI